MKRALIFLLTTILLTLCGSSALAGPAFMGAVNFTEPATDEIVRIRNRGDEHFSYMTDTDGNLLVVDESSYLRYVTEDGGVYALGGYVTKASVPAVGAKVNVNGPVDNLQSKLQALLSEVAAARPRTFAYTTPEIPLHYNFIGDRAEGRVQVCTGEEDRYLDDLSNFPPMASTCPLLVLKLQFKDIKCQFTDAEWHKRIFEDGVSTYYTTVSNGKFTYKPVEETWEEENDGVVTVTLPIDCPRYAIVDRVNNQLVQNDPLSGLYSDDEGKNYAIYNMGSLYAYAVLAADPYVDFSRYDRNGDGFITPTELAVLVVYSGFEASYGGPERAQGYPGVWAHSWTYNNLLSNNKDEKTMHYLTMRVDDVRMSKYTVIGEWANYIEEYDYTDPSKKPRQAQYGTACHELGHDMGLPDLYPTQGANTSHLVEGLSLMATGNWCAKLGDELCSSPTHLDPMSKLYLGFYDAVYADDSGTFTLYASEPSDQYNILRVNTDDPNIYYLIENRQYTGLDMGLNTYYGLRKGGLVIWRVDQYVLNTRWRSNKVNNEEGRYGLMPIFVDDNPELFQPFWSIDSVPHSALLQRLPQLTFTALSLPGGGMDLRIDREKLSAAPVTGDRFQPALWVALGLAALTGAAFLCFLGYKKRAYRNP